MVNTIVIETHQQMLFAQLFIHSNKKKFYKSRDDEAIKSTETRIDDEAIKVRKQECTTCKNG